MAADTIKILVEFPNAAEAVEWFDAAKDDDWFPNNVDLYKADALDLARGSDPGTFIVAKLGERPDENALRVQT